MSMCNLLLSLCFSLCCSVKALQNLYCQLPCNFGLESATHTVCDRTELKCGPAPKCGPDFSVIHLTNDDRQYILDIHNYLRNKVATGYEKPQPKAANMRILAFPKASNLTASFLLDNFTSLLSCDLCKVIDPPFYILFLLLISCYRTYNNELEFVAQCWANACNGNPLIHDRCRRTEIYSHVGQNLGYMNSTNPRINKVKAIKDLILLWYNEVALFNSSWLSDTQNRGPEYVVGHYTQLVWADTLEIGCAISYYTKTVSSRIWHQIILVCNYGPGGNYLGRPVYLPGKPASRCPKGLTRNPFYKGLCGQTVNVKDVANFTFDAFQLE